MRKLLRYVRVLAAFFAGIPTLTAKELSDTLAVNFQKIPVSEAGALTNFNLATSTPDVSARCNRSDSAIFSEPGYADTHWEIRSMLYADPADMDLPTAPVQWFRIKLKVDKEYVNYPIALSFMGVGAMQVYVDGVLKKQYGTFKAGPDQKIQALYLKSAPILLTFDTAGFYQLAIRFQADVQNGGSGLGFDIVDANMLLKTERNSSLLFNVFILGVGAVFFTLFIVHLLFFLFYKKGTSNLYFAIFTLSVAAIFFSIYYFYYATSSSAGPIFDKLINIFPLTASLSLATFTSHIFLSNRRVLIFFILLGTVAGAISILDTKDVTGVSGYLMLIFFLAVILYTSAMIIRGMIKRMPGAFILGSGVLYVFAFFLVILVIALTTGTVNTNFLTVSCTGIAIFSIPLSISAYLAWQFSNTSKALSKELMNVASLSTEKQQILETQKDALEAQVKERTQELQIEKQKSDDLLLNILPQEVAEELKQKGASRAQQYDEVTVLFTDFVNFTAISEKLGVEELLAELNTNFTAFDRIMEKHGLEKIKTIGDAYLAVSGLPVKNEAHAQNAAAAALEIIEFVAARKRQVPYGLDIRIGMHSGSLIAGIIGVKKFAYDIWGDTVNTAARMEQSSVAGQVNISSSTFELIREAFNCEHRGRIEVKGKGALDMYFIKNKI